MFDRRVAHPEVGHAVAMLQYTREFYSAHVLPRGLTTMVDRKGREVACSGLVQGSAFNWDVSGYTRRELEANGIAGLAASAHAYMTIDLAGPFAEARYRRASQAAILLSAGSGDWESASRTARSSQRIPPEAIRHSESLWKEGPRRGMRRPVRRVARRCGPPPHARRSAHPN